VAGGPRRDDRPHGHEYRVRRQDDGWGGATGDDEGDDRSDGGGDGQAGGGLAGDGYVSWTFAVPAGCWSPLGRPWA